MTLYGMVTKRELEIKLTKADIAGLVSTKYGCIIKPEDIGGAIKKKHKRQDFGLVTKQI